MRKFFKDKGKDIMGKAYNHPLYRDYTNSETKFISSYVKRGKLLDVGVGYGKTLVSLINRGIAIHGVDINEEIIKDARDLLGRKAKIQLADANDLPYKDNSFEYVTCMGATFGNFEDPDKCLSEMIRVAKPKGRVVLGVYTKNALDFQLQLYREIGLHITGYDDQAVYSEAISPEDGKSGLICIHRRFTKKRLEEIAKNANAKIKIINLTPVSYVAVLQKV